MDARRRFGQFGSTFVERERVRQARAIEKSQSMMELRETETKERPKISERCRVARGVAKMYNVCPSTSHSLTLVEPDVNWSAQTMELLK